MQLKHIEDTECPVCGARTIAEEQDRQHCNGQWFEMRKFDCGMSIRHVPNFSRNEIASQCPNNPSVVKELKARKKCRNELVEHISRLDLAEEMKKALVDAIDSDWLWRKGLA